MTISSSVRHPENNRYIQVNEWQIKFCQENHCAALLLSFFTNWHDWKLRNDQYYRKANNIAEAHGDGRPYSENAYLFFTTEDLIDGTMNFYGKNAISDAIQLLFSLNVITLHKNPNPRYHFDKTKYFQFFPAVCNQWIAKNYPIKEENLPSQMQGIDNFDTPKEDNRLFENNRRSAEIGQPSSETGQAITNTTIKYKQTNINKLIKPIDPFFESKKQLVIDDTVQEVINVLVEQGFPLARLQYPDTAKNIKAVLQAGASLQTFIESYLETCRAKQTNSFALNYLLKVITSRLEKNKYRNHSHQQSVQDTPQYEENFSAGLQWMGDLV